MFIQRGKIFQTLIITVTYSEENLFRFAQMVMMSPFTQKVKVLWKMYTKLLKCGSVCLLAYALLLGGHFYDLAT